MTIPKRLQLSRQKGYRKPEGAVVVSRPSKWGNPHKVGVSLHRLQDGNYRYMTPSDAVAAFRDEIIPSWTYARDFDELRGKDLLCWCRLCPAHQDGKPLGVDCADCAPCHADVLLEVANR